MPSRYEIFDTMIEVIDPDGRVVVTRHRLNGHAVGFLRNGRLAVCRETEAGVPYEIVALTLDTVCRPQLLVGATSPPAR